MKLRYSVLVLSILCAYGMEEPSSRLVRPRLKADDCSLNALLHSASFQAHTLSGLCKKNPGLIDALDARGDTPLMIAIRKRYSKVVRGLLRQKSSFNTINNDGDTPLLLALAHSQGYESLDRTLDLDIAQKLISLGANINHANNLGKTPLLLALARGRNDIAQQLLTFEAHALTSDSVGDTPLLEAAAQGFIDTVRHIIAQGADVNQANAAGITPLMMASVGGHTATVQELLSKQATILDVQDNDGNTALHYASGVYMYSRARSSRICADSIAALLAHGARGDLLNKHQESMIHLWCDHDRIDLVEEYFDAIKLWITAVDDRGFTPLLYACKKNNYSLVKFLIGHGADSMHRDKAGKLPLYYAKTVALVDLLMEHMPQDGLQDQDYDWLVHTAIQDGNIERLTYFIDNGFSVHKQCLASSWVAHLIHPKQHSLLYHALRSHHEAIILWLFDRGARLSQEEIAQEVVDMQCFTEFIYGLRDSSEYTNRRKISTDLLWHAVNAGHKAMAHYALAYGADPDHRLFRKDTIRYYGPSSAKEMAMPSHFFDQKSPEFQDSAFEVAQKNNLTDMINLILMHVPLKLKIFGR